MAYAFKFNVGDKVRIEGSLLGVGEIIEAIHDQAGERYSVSWPNAAVPPSTHRWDSLALADTETIDHPQYYGGDGTYEVFKVAEAWGLDGDAYLFTVLKYIARAGKKDPTKLNEDLRKARNFLTRRIDHPKES